MSIENKVVKNAAWIIGVKLFQAVFALIVSFLTARYLGPSNYGLLTYAASVVAFMVPIMQLGLNGVMVQELVNKPEQEGAIVGTSMLLSFVASLACMFGATMFAVFANAGDTVTITVCFLYSLMLPAQAIEVIQYWYQAKLYSKYFAVVSFIAYLAVSAYKIFLLATGKSVYWFAVSNAIDYAMIAIALLVIYYRKGSSKLTFSWLVAKRMLSKSWYYIISNITVTIFGQTDRVMLKLMEGDIATGLYSAAAGCVGISSFVFNAIIDSMCPMIYESKKQSEKAFGQHVSRLYSIVIYLALAQSVVMTLFARFFIHTLYGQAYTGAVGILQILVWYAAFSYLGGARGIWILAEGKQKYLLYINFMGAVMNVVLNAALIPGYGAEGAAVASLITQIFVNVVIGFIFKPLRDNNILLMKALNPNWIFSLSKRFICGMIKR